MDGMHQESDHRQVQEAPTLSALELAWVHARH